MSYTTDRRNQLRIDADALSLDLSRGSIQPTEDGGYIVQFGKPLFDLAPFLPTVPTKVKVNGPLQAEIELLHGLRAIQKAERTKCRQGRRHGWSSDQMIQRPLSDDEVAEYRAVLQHNSEVERLRRELSDAVARKDAAAKQRQEQADFESRYRVKGQAVRHG